MPVLSLGSYYQIHPDARARRSWPGLTYIRVRPAWIRYSDYSFDPPRILEFTARELLPGAYPVTTGRR